MLGVCIPPKMWLRNQSLVVGIFVSKNLYIILGGVHTQAIWPWLPIFFDGSLAKLPQVDERLCMKPDGSTLLGCHPSYDGELWACYVTWLWKGTIRFHHCPSRLMEEIRLTGWYGKYHVIYRVLYIPGGAGFLPSTVSGLSDIHWELFLISSDELTKKQIPS